MEREYGGVPTPTMMGQQHMNAVKDRAPQVPVLLDELMGALNEGHEILNMLENRLGPVLRMDSPGIPSGEAGGSLGQPLGPSVADMLKERIRIVRITNSRLGSIIQRLEI